jgi:hypothetical protein
VAAGEGHVLALKRNGDVFAWGYGSLGQLGNGLLVPSSWPVQVMGPNKQGILSGVTSIAAGFNTSVALKGDGTVWAWGDTFGSSPVAVTFPGKIVQIAAGGWHNAALQEDGTVWTWGQNDSGQLGDGTLVNSAQPVKVLTSGGGPPLAGALQIAAGQGNTYARDVQGRVLAWGANAWGQLGDGTRNVSSVPVVVSLPAAAGQIIGLRSGARNAFAWNASTVYGWGIGEYGQLGNGTDVAHGGPKFFVVPVQMLSPPVVDIATGEKTIAELYPDGTVRAQGYVVIGNSTPGIFSSTPISLALTGVAQPEACPAGGYLPSRHGYSIDNYGAIAGPPPTTMATIYYPASKDKIFRADGRLSYVGQWFYDTLFASSFTGGHCYGMAASDTFLYNRASPPLGTYDRWTSSTDAFAGSSITPPVTTNDQTLGDFINRYHARMYGALGAWTSVDVLNRFGYDLVKGNNRTQGNLTAFNEIAARVKTKPQVVAFGPSPYIAVGGPGVFPVRLPDKDRWWKLFNLASHAVVAYDTYIAPDGTRVIKVYDPSSATYQGSSTNYLGNKVIDTPRIEVATDGAVKLITYSGGADSAGNPKAWLGGGMETNSTKPRDMGQPGDWILMPLPDAAFSDGIPNGRDNSHWFIPDGVAFVAELANVPWKLFGWQGPGIVAPIPHFSGSGSEGMGLTLEAGATYDNTITAMGSPALTGMTINDHAVKATQLDANAAGSSHHILVNSTATSIQLDSATQMETFTVEIGADYLPAFSRSIRASGLTLVPSQSLNLASDTQTSGLTISSSSPTATVVSVTLEQTGTNPGKTTVSITVPAASNPASITVSNWNDLAHSLIYATSAINGQQVVTILQDNPVQRTAAIEGLFQQLTTAVGGVTTPDVRDAMTATVQVALLAFRYGDRAITADILIGLELLTKALPATVISASTAASIVSLSQQIRGLL